MDECGMEGAAMEVSLNKPISGESAAVIQSSEKKDKPEIVQRSAREKAREDRIELSMKALSYLQEQQMKATEDQKKEEDPLLKMLEPGEDSSASGISESMKAYSRCFKIASRIMAGDQVPPKDRQYLMEHQPDLYKMAMSLQSVKKEPKKYKSVLEDEEKKQDAITTSDPAADVAMSVEACAEPSPESSGSEITAE